MMPLAATIFYVNLFSSSSIFFSLMRASHLLLRWTFVCTKFVARRTRTHKNEAKERENEHKDMKALPWRHPRVCVSALTYANFIVCKHQIDWNKCNKGARKSNVLLQYFLSIHCSVQLPAALGRPFNSNATTLLGRRQNYKHFVVQLINNNIGSSLCNTCSYMQSMCWFSCRTRERKNGTHGAGKMRLILC